MTAPPDTVSLTGEIITLLANVHLLPEQHVHVDAGPHFYVLRDGPTMQRAIAAAEARGREQGAMLAMAEVKATAMRLSDNPELRNVSKQVIWGFGDSCAMAIHSALIPAPPADGGEG